MLEFNEKEIKRLCKLGLSASEISRHTGMNERTLRGQLKRRNIKCKIVRITSQKYNLVRRRKLLELGFTESEVMHIRPDINNDFPSQKGKAKSRIEFGIGKMRQVIGEEKSKVIQDTMHDVLRFIVPANPWLYARW